MVNKYKKEQTCCGEYKTLEGSFKKKFKIEPVFTHVQLGQINRSHPDQIINCKKQVVFLCINSVGSEYRNAGKKHHEVKSYEIP